MAVPAKEKGSEKYAWILPFVVFVFLLFRGLGAIALGGSASDIGLQKLTGLSWAQIVSQQPGFATFINGTVEEAGLFLVGFAIVGLAISRVSFRKGEKWAWYVMWYLPVFAIGLFLLALFNAEGGGTYPQNVGLLLLDIVLLVLSILGQLLPYRKFFPKSQMTGS